MKTGTDMPTQLVFFILGVIACCLVMVAVNIYNDYEARKRFADLLGSYTNDERKMVLLPLINQVDKICEHQPDWVGMGLGAHMLVRHAKRSGLLMSAALDLFVATWKTTKIKEGENG